MILNSGRHTQPDPQSCRVRSLGGRRGGAQKQTTHQETKTKLSSANANTEKASRQQCRSGISTSPTPCCESLRQQHPNNSKQHGALAKTGDMQAFFSSRLLAFARSIHTLSWHATCSINSGIVINPSFWVMGRKSSAEGGPVHSPIGRHDAKWSGKPDQTSKPNKTQETKTKNKQNSNQNAKKHCKVT